MRRSLPNVVRDAASRGLLVYVARPRQGGEVMIILATDAERDGGVELADGLSALCAKTNTTVDDWQLCIADSDAALLGELEREAQA